MGFLMPPIISGVFLCPQSRLKIPSLSSFFPSPHHLPSPTPHCCACPWKGRGPTGVGDRIEGLHLVFWSLLCPSSAPQGMLGAWACPLCREKLVLLVFWARGECPGCRCGLCVSGVGVWGWPPSLEGEGVGL